MRERQPPKRNEKLKIPGEGKPLNPPNLFFLNAMCVLVLLLLAMQLLLFTWVMANPSSDVIVAEIST